MGLGIDREFPDDMVFVLSSGAMCLTGYTLIVDLQKATGSVDCTRFTAFFLLALLSVFLVFVAFFNRIFLGC